MTQPLKLRLIRMDNQSLKDFNKAIELLEKVSMTIAASLMVDHVTGANREGSNDGK